MSSIPRLYVESDLSAGTAFALEEGQAKYVARVMRLGVGDAVRVFNGRDGEWRCTIDGVTGKRVSVAPETQMREQAERAPTAPRLLFAPLKKTQTDFVVEKATELGVCQICPVITDRTQTRTVRIDRLSKIALEAAEQTERLDLPEIAEATGLETALVALGPDIAVIFCDEAGNDADQPWGGQAGRAKPMAEVARGLETKAVAILIGPEGGFSPEEQSALRQRAGVRAVSLGPRILRAETAAIAALTVWQAVCGDWLE